MEDIKTIDLGALRALAKQRSLVMEELFTLVENALLIAYMKQPGAIKGSRAVIDRTTGEFVILAPELDEDNQKIDEFDDTPNNFGRIAAATVRQVLSQRLRDAEDASVLGEFKDREGTLVSGVIQQGNNPRMVQVDLGTVEAVLPSNEQVPGEKYPHGTRLRAYLVEARRGPKGPSIVVSRSHPNLVLRLFEHEVPEISEGLVSINSIAREAGHRSKIAVSAKNPTINAKGACIGDMGARVRAVAAELNDEKIATGDIVKVAEVVRDLTRRDVLKKLSTGEKRMLTKARGILTSELALARNIEKSAAAERLDSVLAEGRIEIDDNAAAE